MPPSPSLAACLFRVFRSFEFTANENLKTPWHSLPRKNGVLSFEQRFLSSQFTLAFKFKFVTGDSDVAVFTGGIHLRPTPGLAG
mgnify:CR=1 FL=1